MKVLRIQTAASKKSAFNIGIDCMIESVGFMEKFSWDAEASWIGMKHDAKKGCETSSSTVDQSIDAIPNETFYQECFSQYDISPNFWKIKDLCLEVIRPWILML